MTNFYVSLCPIISPLFFLFWFFFAPSSSSSSSSSGFMEHRNSCHRRLRMKDWLYDHLERGDIRGIYWEDRSRLIFRIEWKHGSRHGYSFEKDAVVFKEWAEYTGKLKRNNPDPKRWKANFRCALNSLKNIKKMECRQDRGADAFRRYQFLSCSGDSGEEERDSGEDSKLFAQTEQGKVKRGSNPISALDHKDVKVKREIPDSPNSPQTRIDSCGSVTGDCFYYPLDQNSRYKMMTPPNSPGTEPVAGASRVSSALRCNSCNVSEWGDHHSPFCNVSNPPMSPPLTPPNGGMLPDLDIESLSPSQAVDFSNFINPDVFNDIFDECSTQF